jgi:hypothetical protein
MFANLGKYALRPVEHGFDGMPHQTTSQTNRLRLFDEVYSKQGLKRGKLVWTGFCQFGLVLRVR